MSNEITTKKKMTPPPKKAEIIEAMAIIERQKLLDEAPKTKERLREAMDKLESCAKVKIPNLCKLGKYEYHSVFKDHVRVCINIEKKDLPTAFIKLIQAAEEAQKNLIHPYSIPSLSAVKSQIRDKLSGHPQGRVAALVQDPEFRKTAQKALEDTTTTNQQ